ncbi:hypothetical protein GOODEAATRI_002997 [Goodea atripinnis]|uniref:Uncharacterized protein n=1 Tax=Goodea atripinnis TaxID=208336 RepID=A0ABV0PAX2_9TELE
MSTYLVAFIVCDFKSVSAATSSGVKVSIYAAPEKWMQTHYALEVAVKMLDFYEEYFNIRYPLPKQGEHLNLTAMMNTWTLQKGIPLVTQKYILQFFRTVIDQQTWSDSGTVSERRLRSEVLFLACHLDYPPCLQRANQHFKDWLRSNGTLKSV